MSQESFGNPGHLDMSRFESIWLARDKPVCVILMEFGNEHDTTNGLRHVTDLSRTGRNDKVAQFSRVLSRGRTWKVGKSHRFIYPGGRDRRQSKPWWVVRRWFTCSQTVSHPSSNHLIVIRPRVTTSGSLQRPNCYAAKPVTTQIKY